MLKLHFKAMKFITSSILSIIKEKSKRSNNPSNSLSTTTKKRRTLDIGIDIKHIDDYI